MVVGLATLGSPAVAQDPADDPAAEVDAGFVEVFEVSGLLDPVMADALENAIISADRDGARALVLQLNSPASVVSVDRLNELATLMSSSAVPVSVWVGPSGSRARGHVAQLVSQADAIGVSIGSTFGDAGPQVLDPGRFGDIWDGDSSLLESTALTWEQAVERGIVACDRVDVDELGNELTPEQSLARCANPTIGDFLVSLDQFDAEVVQTDDGPRLSPLTRTRLRGLSLLDQLMHTVASPPVAYLLFVIGLALLVFEFFSIGIGIAGVIGAVLVALGSYGLDVLPVRTWAVVLLVSAMVAFAIDIQTAVAQAWTIIGMVAFVVGTLFLYPRDDVSMSWIPMVVAVVGMAVVMWRGMPIMVRGRFSTTRIDRSFLVDDTASAAGAFTDGTGLVTARGVEWPAVAAPTVTDDISDGASVVVVDVDGIAVTVDTRPEVAAGI